MAKLSYEEVRKLELNATTKLLNYIKSEVEVEEILNEINCIYPYFSDENSKITFDIWLSIDFLDKDGQSFIDKFLNENKKSLKVLERDILQRINESYISLFEVIGFEDDLILIKDILLNKEMEVWEPKLCNLLKVGDFLFARTGKVLDNYNFIGEINYLPNSVKPLFIEELLISLNKQRITNNDFTVKDFLKKFSLELYRIYNYCIINALEDSEDISTFLYDEIYEFENYLISKRSIKNVKQHISNLIEFFDYYLSDEDLTLYDIDQIDFKYFFKNAIKDGFINTQEELNSYINTLTKYACFLNNRTSLYREVYLELLEISEDRFKYMGKLEVPNLPFNIDKRLVDKISLNEIAITLIINLDKFILYAIDKPLELTAKNNYIKRKHLLEIDDLFDGESLIRKKSPNQKDFPIIHLFYTLSIKLGFMRIEGNYLTITKQGTNFIRLRDEDKFVILFNFLWTNEFISEVTELNNNIIDIVKKNFIDMIVSFGTYDSYSIATIISTFDNIPNFFVKYNKYLKYLGLIKTNFYPDYNFQVTDLGKTVFRYLKDKYDNPNTNSIVYLNSYREKK